MTQVYTKWYQHEFITDESYMTNTYPNTERIHHM